MSFGRVSGISVPKFQTPFRSGWPSDVFGTVHVPDPLVAAAAFVAVAAFGAGAFEAV
jgi:hypothetical protein